MNPDKLLTYLFLALALFAATFAHINQGLRLELARAEERLLDERRVIGWWMRGDYGQFYFVPRTNKRFDKE
jgi:hypothetical protein